LPIILIVNVREYISEIGSLSVLRQGKKELALLGHHQDPLNFLSKSVEIIVFFNYNIVPISAGIITNMIALSAVTYLEIVMVLDIYKVVL
jgi:hypothetical protein